MGSYAERKAYEAGLEGSKPWLRDLAPELYDAQMEGYKQHLANKNLAEAIADQVEEREERKPRRDDVDYGDDDERPPRWVRDYYSDSYTAPPSKPAPPIKPETNWQRATSIGVAALLLWFDYEIAVCWAGDHYDASFIGMVVRGVGNVCFNERRNFPSILQYLGDFHLPSQQVFTLAFFAHYIIFPGVFLLWPAIKLISIATRELERKDKNCPK